MQKSQIFIYLQSLFLKKFLGPLGMNLKKMILLVWDVTVIILLLFLAIFVVYFDQQTGASQAISFLIVLTSFSSQTEKKRKKAKNKGKICKKESTSV